MSTPTGMDNKPVEQPTSAPVEKKQPTEPVTATGFGRVFQIMKDAASQILDVFAKATPSETATTHSQTTNLNKGLDDRVTTLDTKTSPVEEDDDDREVRTGIFEGKTVREMKKITAQFTELGLFDTTKTPEEKVKIREEYYKKYKSKTESSDEESSSTESSNTDNTTYVTWETSTEGSDSAHWDTVIAENKTLKEQIEHLTKQLSEIQENQASSAPTAPPYSEVFAPPPPSPEVFASPPPPPMPSDVLFAPPPPPAAPPFAGIPTATPTAPGSPGAQPAAPPPSFGQVRTMLRKDFVETFQKLMAEKPDVLEFLSNDKDEKVLRNKPLVAESILRQIFESHPGILPSDIDEAIGTGNTKRNEGKVLRTFFSELLKPSSLMGTKEKVQLKAVDSPVKAEVAQEKVPASTQELLPTVMLFLEAQGEALSSNTRQLASEDALPKFYGLAKAEATKFCKNKLGLANDEIKTILKDPDNVYKYFLQAKQDKDKDKALELYANGMPIAENEKGHTYGIIREEVRNYLIALGVVDTEEILSDPTKTLESYQDLQLLRLSLYDKGLSTDYKDLKTPIQNSLKAVKNEILNREMRRAGKQEQDEVADYVYTPGHFLEKYQELRHDTSTIPRVDKRLGEYLPDAIGNTAFDAGFVQLQEGKFPPTFKLLFRATSTPSVALLDRILERFEQQDVKSQEKILSALDPIQQLWLLETAVTVQVRTFIIEFMANQIFDAIKVDSTASSDKKDAALKLLSYLKDNRPIAKPYQQVTYDSVLAAIQKKPGYNEIKAYL